MQANHSTPDRIAVYARVSTEDQAERQTIQGQLDFLRKYCDLHGHQIAGEYLDDGISGTVPLDERPEGRRLLDDAAAGRFGVVLVYRLDRLGRSLKALIGAHDALESAGVAIRSGTEPFDTSTPIGRFVFQLLGSIAELERESIKERTTMGRDRVARNGKYTGGRLPYGYDVDADGRLVPSSRIVPALETTEAEVVRELFRRVAAGSSALAETQRLSALGVVPTTHYQTGTKLSRGELVWRPSRIGSIIHNPVYKGDGHVRSRNGDITYTVPPLVDEATWQAAQARLATNRRLSKKNAKRTYLLRGLIRCQNCGLGYVGTAVPSPRADGRSVETRLYRCAGTTGAITQAAGRCQGKSVSADQLEAAIWQQCAAYARDPGAYLADAQASIRERMAQSVSHEGERRKLLDDLAAKETERERVLTMFRRGRITMDEADEQLEAVARETATVRELLESLRAQDALAAAAEAHLTQTASALAILRDDIDAIEAMPDGEEKTARMREIVELLVVRIDAHTEVLAAAGDGRQRAKKQARFSAALAYRESRHVAVEPETGCRSRSPSSRGPASVRTRS